LASTQLCRGVEIEHKHGRTTEVKSWPAPDAEPVVKIINLNDQLTSERAMQLWPREEEAQVGAGVFMWWTDESFSNAGQGGAAVVCQHGNECSTSRSYQRAGHKEVFNAELWAIGQVLRETVKTIDRLQRHGANTVAVFSNSRGGIRQMAHPDTGLVSGCDSSGQLLQVRISVGTELLPNLVVQVINIPDQVIQVLFEGSLHL
jgi:hypothetical protein